MSEQLGWQYVIHGYFNSQGLVFPPGWILTVLSDPMLSQEHVVLRYTDGSQYLLRINHEQWASGRESCLRGVYVWARHVVNDSLAQDEHDLCLGLYHDGEVRIERPVLVKAKDAFSIRTAPLDPIVVASKKPVEKPVDKPTRLISFTDDD